jgi:hypothetical protein
MGAFALIGMLFVGLALLIGGVFTPAAAVIAAGVVVSLLVVWWDWKHRGPAAL